MTMTNVKISNLVNRNNNAVPNQFVLRAPEAIHFQSYDSPIVTIEGDVIYLYEDWDYSNTTMKHFKAFMEDNASHIYHYESASKFRRDIPKLIKSLNLVPMY